MASRRHRGHHAFDLHPEFEDHRPLYDWFLANLPVPSKPHQYEFARLNLTYTVLSKRVLTTLVRDGHVKGWDDPRMPTLAGLRRRGVRPGDPRFRQAYRRRRRLTAWSTPTYSISRSRGAEQDRAAADGRAPPAQGGDRKL
jgi:glutamyl/glutaminyl-tRNA synthetase